jgi:RNA polymerase-associated protein LEO1
LTSPEREHREALEYGEHGHAQDLADMDEVKEAEVAFPNIPVPRSSDGDVNLISSSSYQNMVAKWAILFTELGYPHTELCHHRFKAVPP